MLQMLQDIFHLEDEWEFNRAFQAYSEIYSRNKSDYVIWKHFYFFLWMAIEEAPTSFQDKVDLDTYCKQC